MKGQNPLIDYSWIKFKNRIVNEVYMNGNNDKKQEEKESPKKMSLRFSNELIGLRERLKKTKEDGSFDSAKNEIQENVLDIAKRMLREILDIPSSYTYEEIETYVSNHKGLDDEGKTHVRIISSLLSDTEFSPKPEYDRLNSIIEGLLSFTEWSTNYIPGKGTIKKKKKNKFFSGLWYIIKAATFIFWFPFYWFFTSAKRFSEKNKINEDPSYPLKKEIKKANKHHSRKDMKQAIQSYEKIREEYNKSPAEVKALVRPDIISLHEKIMSDYKSMAEKKSK